MAVRRPAIRWVLLASQDRFSIRPEMLSFLLLQATVWLLGTARPGAARRLWLLVPLMLLWINVHSLFVLGVFAIGATLATRILAEHIPLPRAWREGTVLPRAIRDRMAIAAVLSIAVTVLNPYFVRGVASPFKLLSRFDSASIYAVIGEFQSPFRLWLPDLTIGAFQVLFLFGCGAVVAAGAASALGRTRNASDAVPAFGRARAPRARATHRSRRREGAPARRATGRLRPDAGGALHQLVS